MTTVYVRFVPFIAGEKSGSIILSSSGINKSISLNAAAVEPEVPLALDNFSIEIFPNPIIDNLTISGLKGKNTELILIDLMGKVVFKDVVNSKKVEFKLGALKSGLYFLKIKQQDNTRIFRLIAE